MIEGIPDHLQDKIERALRAREYVALIALIALFITLNIIFHTVMCSTPMQGLTDAQWNGRVTVHLHTYPFFRRIPFTYLVTVMHRLTHWPMRQSFYTLQYILLAAASILFYRYLRRLRMGFAWALCGVGLFLSAYPVLLGFSEPVHTWDDIWVYCALILTFGGLFRRNVILAAAAFTVALYAREQTLTIFPIYALGAWLFSPHRKLWPKIVVIAAPLVIYAPFFLPGWQVPRPTGEISDVNWGSGPKVANSIFSLCISFGVLWLTWLLGLVRYFRTRSHDYTPAERYVVWTSLYVVLATLVVVMEVGFIRETRLLFPAFLFTIPISLYWLRHTVSALAGSALWRSAVVVLIGGIAIFCGMDWAVRWLPDLDYRNCPAICQGWLGVHFGLAVATVLAAVLTWFSEPPQAPATNA